MDNEPPLSLTNTEMSYTHITASQQNELSVLLRTDTKQKDIARLLGKNRVTIWRERIRNGQKNGKYHARKAKKIREERRIEARRKRRRFENNLWLRTYVERHLKKHWSPEQIAGRLKKDYPNDKSKRIGKDSIYGYLYEKRKDLVKYLRCQKGKYRRRYGTRIREKRREEAKKKRIDTRPVVVETKKRIGDREGDTIVGKDAGHILTRTERKSGILFVDKLSRGTALLTREKTVKRFSKIPRKKKRTVTYDNGPTFSDHELTEQETGIEIYFAHPYHSWERGCNENSNGLLRQYFPKGIPFEGIQQKEIDKAVHEINHRPRKRLQYATPYEVFYEKNAII